MEQEILEVKPTNVISLIECTYGTYEGTYIGTINCLKDHEKRTSRRMIVLARNPCQIKEGVLPSCHNFFKFQFHVSEENKLSCSLYQRSNDTALGTSFNISSYAFFNPFTCKTL